MTPLLWIPVVALAWYRYATEDWLAPWMFWGLVGSTVYCAWVVARTLQRIAARRRVERHPADQRTLPAPLKPPADI